MKLKKSVCKACREQAFGKKGWNQFAEAWFTNEDGATYCPFTITDKMTARIKKDVDAIVSKYPVTIRDAINRGYITVDVKNINAPKWYVTCKKPPLWCPFSEYHYNKGIHKLPIRVTRHREEIKKKYPHGTKLWHDELHARSGVHIKRPTDIHQL